MHLRIRTFVGVLALILGCTFVFGQTISNTFKPSAADQKLGVMVGSWIAHGTLKTSDSAPPDKYSSTSTCGWTADRFGLICHSVEDIPGMGKVAVTSIVAYDSHSRSYLSLEVGASGTRLSRGNVEGNTWTWTSTPTNETERLTVKYTSQDSCHWTLEVGPNWQSLKPIMQVTETRLASK
ncbi:MAG TPA: DUF1579 family protein [Candidatus Sulfotelmatobacter sp.]|nr:DUF1579 family protein [Candidatus Sulfotelmatobacter sp.]